MEATGLIAIASLVAYAIGSIPFGLITARLVAGVDIRRVGSGNIGATNVARIVGARFGALVLALDALKGGLPTALLPRLFLEPGDPNFLHARVLCGVAAILGHMFPCWIGFRGGKGVATALGVVLVLGPMASLAAIGAFAACFALSRIVSLSAIVAACTFGLAETALLMPSPFDQSTWSLATFSLLAPLLIVVRHRANIARLIRGEEPRFKSGTAKRDNQADTPDVKK